MLLFLSIVFGLVCLGDFQQDMPIEDYDRSRDNNVVAPSGNNWPLQSFQQYYGHVRRSSNQMPCPRRKLPDEETWIPTFTAKIVKPIKGLQTHDFQPQSLTDGGSQTTENPLDDVKNKMDIFFDKIRNSVDHLAVVAKNDIEGNNLEKGNGNNKDISENKMGETMEDEDLVKINRRDNDKLVSQEEINTQSNEPRNESSDDDRNSNNDEDTFNVIHPSHNVPDNLNRNVESGENEDKHAVDDYEKDSDSEELENEKIDVLLRRNDVPEIKGTTVVKCQNNKPLMNGKQNIIGNLVNSRRSMTNSMDENKFQDAPNGLNENKNLNNFLKLDNEMNHRIAADSLEPTDEPVLSDMSDSRVMLMKNSRVCYACTTASNPTCWTPDRKTTVKYCNKEHESCVTKTFGAGSTLTLIRDCASSCTDSDIPGFSPKYKSCALCHSDLCNGAFTINSQSLLFAFFLLIAVKSMN